MKEPLHLRKMCRVCGAWKVGKDCYRCQQLALKAQYGPPVDAEYERALARHRAARASRRFRPAIHGRLRGQVEARHRRGGVRYDENDIQDDYGRGRKD